MATKLEQNDDPPKRKMDYVKVVMSKLEDNKLHASELDLVGPVDSTNQTDLVPKDAGWAWMCCLGMVLFRFDVVLS